MAKFADSIETDLHGNVIVGINTSAKRKPSRPGVAMLLKTSA
jgi:hypothetical protein